MRQISEDMQRINNVLQADKSVMTDACKALVLQDFAEKFKAANGGSIVCRELLGLDKSGQRETPMPSQRTAEYYKKRPCVQIIGEAARIVAEKLIETNK